MAGELSRFQPGVSMAISRLDAWYSDGSGSVESTAAYIIRGLCRRCCLPETILRSMQVIKQIIVQNTYSFLLSLSSVDDTLFFVAFIWQACIALSAAGDSLDNCDKLIELVGSAESGMMHLFSQQQLQVTSMIFHLLIHPVRIFPPWHQQNCYSMFVRNS